MEFCVLKMKLRQKTPFVKFLLPDGQAIGLSLRNFYGRCFENHDLT